MADKISIRLIGEAIQELGLKPIIQIGLYRLGLLTGYWRLRTPRKSKFTRSADVEIIEDYASDAPTFPLTVPDRETLSDLLGDETSSVLRTAEQVIQNKVWFYGGNLQTIRLSVENNRCHWTKFRLEEGEDIKDIWESARFGWTYPLGRAYVLTKNERYAEAFWNLAETFLDENPPNTGPNWISAQEVAIRITAMTFAWQVFLESPHSTHTRLVRLITAIADHAVRILPTMIYARAQNNNHLLIEALGLFTAGQLLSGLPCSKNWRETGWRWINATLEDQISPDGTYIQHSMNYHRLMMHAALWVASFATQVNITLLRKEREKLASATAWLAAQIDPLSGRMPNLGNNDGALLLPFSSQDISDYRSLVQTASRMFLDEPYLPPGIWDEAGLWLGLRNNRTGPEDGKKYASPGVHKIGDSYSWATMRAAQFNSRPAHADQLHVDLWWLGHNIASDAGTYRYTASDPWNNTFAGTAVHNTITVEGKDQMRRVGRFLWLKWAQARILEQENNEYSICAQHNGYAGLGVLHRRKLTRVNPDNWLVEDIIHPLESASKTIIVSLHWLLPDWSWELNATVLKLQAPCGTVSLAVTSVSADQTAQTQGGEIQLIRAGDTVAGPTEETGIFGWISPTYGHKVPAISLRYHFQGLLPFRIISKWQFSASIVED
ncbi:MAG: heparinase II/III family protein [Anaerolineaceae bacterium]|nr:heparinase II/III family protein [Anaerolineaceae bacterium]